MFKTAKVSLREYEEEEEGIVKKWLLSCLDSNSNSNSPLLLLSPSLDSAASSSSSSSLFLSFLPFRPIRADNEQVIS